MCRSLSGSVAPSRGGVTQRSLQQLLLAAVNASRGERRRGFNRGNPVRLKTAEASCRSLPPPPPSLMLPAGCCYCAARGAVGQMEPVADEASSRVHPPQQHFNDGQQRFAAESLLCWPIALCTRLNDAPGGDTTTNSRKSSSSSSKQTDRQTSMPAPSLTSSIA